MKTMMYSFKLNDSLSMMNMNKLNDKMMLMMMMLMIMITMMLLNKNKMTNKSMMENQMMETLWTLFPSLMIILMSYMSIPILYMNNEMKMAVMSIKITGNQWFWNYKYLNFNKTFNSYMMYKKNFNFNIMETENKMVIPFNMQILTILTSMDVIHSWSVPSLNVKTDVIPGQINSSTIQTNKINIMFGNCSEICGMNHSFMPITIESITMGNFIKWVKNN